MIVVRDLGSSLGIRSSLITGPAGADISNDVRYLTQNSVQVVVGTPARVHDIFAGQFGAGVPAGEVRLLIVSAMNGFPDTSADVSFHSPPSLMK